MITLDRLTDIDDLDLVLPSRKNVRRRRLDQYMATNTIEPRRLIEIDSMFTTLDLVARSDWATILPGIICLSDLDGERRRITPLSGPGLTVDYLRIEPKSVPLSDAAQAFFSVLSDELAAAFGQLEAARALQEAAYPEN